MKWLAFGDSITAYGAYPNILEWNRLAFSGWDTANWRSKLPIFIDAVKAEDYTDVMILLGANDASRGFTVHDYTVNQDVIRGIFNGAGIEVSYLLPYKRPGNLEKSVLLKFYGNQLQTRCDIGLAKYCIDLWPVIWGEHLPDDVHIDLAGHTLIATEIKNTIQNTGTEAPELLTSVLISIVLLAAVVKKRLWS